MDMNETRPYEPARSRWAHLLGQLGGERDEHSSLRAVVRGEQPLGRIFDTIAQAPAVERITTPHVSVSAADLAEGIMNLKDDPAALSEWAGFILATCDLFELEDENCEYWDRLLACVWELALGAALGGASISMASAVRNRHGLA